MKPDDAWSTPSAAPSQVMPFCLRRYFQIQPRYVPDAEQLLQSEVCLWVQFFRVQCLSKSQSEYLLLHGDCWTPEGPELFHQQWGSIGLVFKKLYLKKKWNGEINVFILQLLKYIMNLQSCFWFLFGKNSTLFHFSFFVSLFFLLGETEEWSWYKTTSLCFEGNFQCVEFPSFIVQVSCFQI